MRRQKTPALVNLAIYTTITIFLWIFFDIYRALKKPAILDIDKKILEPINPNLDKTLLNEIDKSIYFDKQMFNNQVIEINSNTEPPKSTTSGQFKE
jgi:hypothetical protein